MLMFLFFFVMVCGLFVWKRFCAFLCFIVRIDVGDPIIKRLNLNIFYCLNNDKRIRHKFFNLVLSSPYTYNIIYNIQYDKHYYYIISLKFAHEDMKQQVEIYINQYISTTFPCLSKAITWISNVICHGPFIIVQCLEEVVHFVDIGGIVDHHLFKFHFIILRIFIRLSTNRLQFNQVFINNKQSDI